MGTGIAIRSGFFVMKKREWDLKVLSNTMDSRNTWMYRSIMVLSNTMDSRNTWMYRSIILDRILRELGVDAQYFMQSNKATLAHHVFDPSERLIRTAIEKGKK
jgi:hypothetical protein